MMHTPLYRSLFHCGLAIAVLALAACWPAAGLAQQIDPGDKFAWAENAGWINFNPDGADRATVHGSHLEGYVWGENIGWISLGTYTGGGTHTYLNTSASDYGVNRSGEQLSGFAWAENAGWINFGPSSYHDGVRIDTATGEFHGYAWGENIGWIKCSGTAGDGALYGVDINTYTVTFQDYDGTALKTETVAHGGSATAPADPARTGYTFTGWNTAFVNVTSNLTVTAQYEINTYTVTFQDYDGTALKTETVAYGGSATAPSDPARTGYTFTGWNTAFVNVASNLTVTAQYEINTYTVTFQDHDGAALKTETVAYGGSATAPSDPARTGYTFTGWNTAFVNVTSNLTVTAQYEINTYTVTFQDYDGAALKTETVIHGNSATAPADPVREGYTFTGWEPAFDNISTDLTVTAQYEVNTYSYTLTYYAGANGVITGTSPQTVIDGGDGSAVTAVADTGYSFVQWSDGLTSNPRTDTHVTTNIAVTAEFAANPIEKGDIDNDSTLDLADAILALQICAGIDPNRNIYKTADVNGDERIGIEEAIYILRSIID